MATASEPGHIRSNSPSDQDSTEFDPIGPNDGEHETGTTSADLIYDGAVTQQQTLRQCVKITLSYASKTVNTAMTNDSSRSGALVRPTFS